MKRIKVALVELGGSHDECLLTQLEALETAHAEIVLVTNRHLYDRNPHLHRFCSAVYFIEPQGKAIGDLRLMLKLVKYFRKNGISKVVFNTAQGGHVRNLALFMPRSIQCYGIIHTIRKFQGSLTQRIIDRKVKRYVVLSDDLLQRVQPPKGIFVGSFYPVSFPATKKPVEKPFGEAWITITGGVENRRKDLTAVIDFIRETPLHVRFVFLGKTDPSHPDTQAFLTTIKEQGLEKRIMYFTDFVDHDLFDAMLKQTDLLLPLIHPGTPSAEQYINNQISGAFTLAFGYHIPLLIHRYYQTEKDLQLSANFYTPETFADELEEALEERTSLSESIAHVAKWQKPFQYRNYLSFLEWKTT